jgi:hypothetical protein
VLGICFSHQVPRLESNASHEENVLARTFEHLIQDTDAAAASGAGPSLRYNAMFKRTLTVGTDTVGLGIRPQASRMRNKTIALMQNPPSSYIGVVGISPVPINYTEDNIPVPTFFESMRSSTRIAGRTWSYTAGSVNSE